VRGNVRLFAPIREYVDSLVHPSAQQDAPAAARHRAFIGPRLLGSLAALAGFSVYLIIRGVPSTIEVVVLAWLATLILVAYFVQEQALERARADAERASIAKSRFLATVSHELRTPLNAIIGFSEMLAKEGSLALALERRQEYAHLINESGRHLLSVVNSILDISRIETGNFEVVPELLAPEQVISDGCRMLALEARTAGIEIVLRLPEKLPRIVADKCALSQVVLNLVANAIKFSNPGGCVTVSARVRGEMIVVTVEDNGVGIGAEDLPQVGNPFFQARSSYDRRHDGSGLGLSIVKGLLALHGGGIEIASRLGEGTRVTVHVPVSRYSARLSAPPPIERLVPRGFEQSVTMRTKKSA
jgi:two-component system, cell cycle sensor histidine kinase DivJ